MAYLSGESLKLILLAALVLIKKTVKNRRCLAGRGLMFPKQEYTLRNTYRIHIRHRRQGQQVLQPLQPADRSVRSLHCRHVLLPI